MHRLIMLSSVYQQSSVPNPGTLKMDPDNKLFGRMNRQRLTVEALRDSVLAAGGSLDPSLGGAPVREAKNNRRTLYLMTVRSDADNFRCLFDAADPTAIVEQRPVSTVAPQALFLLNSPFVLEQARILARRAQETGGIDDPGRIDWLYRRLYRRPPIGQEIESGLAFIGRVKRVCESAPAGSAWQEYCQVLLCANEFIYVD